MSGQTTTAKPGAAPAGAPAGQPEKRDDSVPADLLKQAAAVPKDVKLEEYNPMENIPTLAVGDDFKPGMTVAGWYEETQRIASKKFIHSKEVNEKGVPVQLRFILRVGSPTGTRLGIWQTAELANTFEKLTPGTFISITYLRKGLNGNNMNQHFFKYERQVPQ